MTVETVKVYKGKDSVVVNKADVEEWNDRGYLTSSQQKKAAEEKKNKLSPAQQKELEEKEREEAESAAIEAFIQEGLDARKKAGEPDLTEEEMVQFKAYYTEEYKTKDKE